GGQKTGFFLDQRDKRLALAKYVEGKNVLNCFSYSGGFSVYALGAGAKHVVSVDSSQSALELAEENVKLNKLDLKKCEFICGDVKQYLNDPEHTQASFDVIILDPPAFVKDRRKVQEGLMGYKKINEAALRLLSGGGMLVTASCSAHVTLSDFRYMLSESAGRSRRTLQVLETHTHGLDHPELVAFTEGEYLKCLFARVI
ncbi:MAG: class I SAM-dependent methyltransferase, partial [Patescibacteria group bacterium]